MNPFRNYSVPIPTLKTLSIVNVISILIKKVPVTKNIEYLQNVETALKSLNLPPGLSEKAFRMYDFMETELEMWCTSPVMRGLKRSCFINHIEWSPYGKIDEAKTLLRHIDELGHTEVIVRACRLYLEELVTDDPATIGAIVFFKKSVGTNDIHLTYWLNTIARGNLEEYYYYFNQSVKDENKYGMKYFWRFLNHEQRFKAIQDLANRSSILDSGFEQLRCAEVILFMLCDLTDNEFEDVLKAEHAIKILLCLLLLWPAQDAFDIFFKKLLLVHKDKFEIIEKLSNFIASEVALPCANYDVLPQKVSDILLHLSTYYPFKINYKHARNFLDSLLVLYYGHKTVSLNAFVDNEAFQKIKSTLLFSDASLKFFNDRKDTIFYDNFSLTRTTWEEEKNYTQFLDALKLSSEEKENLCITLRQKYRI